ncbi:MAG: CatB-related O-acetyltransferase [Holosporales bacterium]|jgi:virginiamycin A acetyltransferase|nr:CatB-related O-acetyltransferase [Holosporales bacterium]
MTDFPHPNTKYPLNCGLEQTAFLKAVVTNPNIIVGDYSYYDDNEDDPANFEKHVLYHFDFLGDKLIIGKFCQIASGIQILMNGIWHNMNCFTTYPFSIFSKEISQKIPPDFYPTKGDTVIDNDVWIGMNVTIMPGVHIGDGAIIGTSSLVTKDVEPYSIVGGNPAKLIRKRFSDAVIKLLLEVQWWNWDIEKILSNIDVVLSNNVWKLKAIG